MTQATRAMWRLDTRSTPLAEFRVHEGLIVSTIKVFVTRPVATYFALW
jgi:hypothetical protein